MHLAGIASHLIALLVNRAMLTPLSGAPSGMAAAGIAPIGVMPAVSKQDDLHQQVTAAEFARTLKYGGCMFLADAYVLILSTLLLAFWIGDLVAPKPLALFLLGLAFYLVIMRGWQAYEKYCFLFLIERLVDGPRFTCERRPYMMSGVSHDFIHVDGVCVCLASSKEGMLIQAVARSKAAAK